MAVATVLCEQQEDDAWAKSGLSDEALLAIEMPGDAAADARSFYSSIHQQAQHQHQQGVPDEHQTGDEDEFGCGFLSDEVLLSMVP